ncbi:Gfo/Idh/MocA family protein [Leptospira adleri]|uniref:Oxidoreductase n=1 Tax=Leptospira adleri TaxID=2023186 RepID=A0A2M9YP42_9LEPT|nr:Gfo/Idh/MocA family oxidoreductase [Leptospira adleri]PJZ53301.1 oxidoreductase [Leptospira adleri]PJZ63891.1 oxidoreductase [Leptospira adleri]
MIPVLLIGLGRIASLLEKDSLRNHPCTHAGSLFSPWGKKKFFLVGAIDPSKERTKQFCKDWNIPKEACFSDFKDWSASFHSPQNGNEPTKSRNSKTELRLNSSALKKVVPTSTDIRTSSNTTTSDKKLSVRISSHEKSRDSNGDKDISNVDHKQKRGNSNEDKSISQNVDQNRKRGNSNAAFVHFEIQNCLVVIATPSDTHFELAKTVIGYGFRHLLVEKPVCHSLPLAKKLAKLCRETGTDLRVNHERRYHPLYKQVRKWIQKETFGPVRTIRASVLTSARNPGRAILDQTGPLFHDGTHAVDLLTWYLGVPDRVHSVLRSYPHSPVEEQAVALLTYPKGETVFLETGGMRKYFQFELDIQTESARFLVGNDEVRFWKSKPSRKYKGFNSLTPVSISEKSSAGSNPFLNLYEALFRHLSGKPSEITGDMEENLQILTILETIRKKAEKRILEV